MPTIFLESSAAPEDGLKAFDVSFTDENGSPVVPNTGLAWSLYDENKIEIVNERSGVPIDPPAASITIVLSGDDLAILHDRADGLEWRHLFVYGTYNGSLGNNLPIRDYCRFPVIAMPG